MNNIISIAADFSNDKCYPTAYVVKGDTGDLFNIRLTHDGNDADLSDVTLALITFRQGEFSASQEGTIEGSTVSFTLNPACVRIGANLGEVALYHNETLVTTALFCVAVRSSLQDEGTTIPEEESPTLIEFIEKYSGGSGGNVLSVNGKTGDVVLSANDVGADTAGTASTLVNAKPGEKCEGKTFSVHTGELTDANILKFNSDGSFPSEQKTASADSERFNAYAERGVYQNAAIGECSTVFGSRSWVIGDGGFASGTNNLVKGLLGVAFGIGHYLYESSQKGFACGSNNRLQGILEFVSGTGNYSNGYASHVEGASNQMHGKYAHAEGAYNENYGYACHVEGRGNIADGGRGPSNGKPQHVEGQYNVQDGTQTYAHIVGNGTSKSDRSNAHTLNYDGTAWYANAVKVGGTSETDAKTLATEDFVTSAINAALYVDSETEVG